VASSAKTTANERIISYTQLENTPLLATLNSATSSADLRRDGSAKLNLSPR
jgi:hypothetical protein